MQRLACSLMRQMGVGKMRKSNKSFCPMKAKKILSIALAPDCPKTALSALFKHNNTAGLGVIICDVNDAVMGALSMCIPLPHLVATVEVQVCRRAMQFAVEIGLHEVTFEGDAVVVINAITDQSSYGHVIGDILAQATLFSSFEYCYVNRSFMEINWVSVVCPWKAFQLHVLPLLLLLVLLRCSSPCQCVVDLDPDDKALLLAFKSRVQDPGQSLSSWVGTNCTSWSGLTCENRTGRVVSINLTNMNLSGKVLPKLCKLSFLEDMNLSHNNFTCPIPLCFGNLVSLRAIDLSHNRFLGVVPDTLMRLRNLKELVLNGNRDLRGLVPGWLGNFSTNLEKLDLASNSFCGEIPESLLYLKPLKYLDLGNNNLSGNLRDFGQSLLVLNLESNQFSGTLPCLSASAQSLNILNMANNSIVGGIPTCVASLQALTHLNLSFNHLKYAISPRLVFSENLLVLDLSNNDLLGPLPHKIAETTDKSGLVLLDLSHNQFSGEIPLRITELKSLQALFLSHNLLTGEIPARIGNLTYLQVIDLSHNLLSELDALDSLKILDLSNNMISGFSPWLRTNSMEIYPIGYSHLKKSRQ
nr:leucine-rich repeat receptor-like protein clavata2 [Quercus suber]